MLMARMLRIEAPIADLALPFFDDAVGRTVLNVLVVCFPVGKGTVAGVVVGHCEWPTSPSNEKCLQQKRVRVVEPAEFWGDMKKKRKKKKTESWEFLRKVAYLLEI
jgi:hypothetical protein